MINKKTSIKIFSPSIDLLGEIDDYTSFIITRNYNDTGDFSLRINFNKNNTEYLVKNNILIIDNNGNKAGIIKHREISLDEKGNEVIDVKGFTLDVVLNQRIAVLPPNEEEVIFSGRSGELIENLVDENLIHAKDMDRNISNLIIDTKLIGNNIVWKLEPRKVNDIISEVSKVDGLGYRITVDTEKKLLVFNLYQGAGKTVIFSPVFNNISNMKYTDNSIEEKNVVYIDINNIMTPYGDSSGLDRQETYLEYGELKDTETIEEVGRHELSRYPKVESVEADIMPYNSFIYEKDYDLGDIVTVENRKWNIQQSLRITSIQEVYETQSRIRVTFGQPAPTFQKKLRNYITNMR